jgi:hypothetical protein
MAEVTYFVALPFVAADDGIAAGEPTECFNPVAVVMRAEALSRKPGHVGAVAFSRTGDPATGEFGDAKVIKKFGEVPDDLSTLRKHRGPLGIISSRDTFNSMRARRRAGSWAHLTFSFSWTSPS